MKFTSFLRKKLVDLLIDRRIVVWYDAERNFTSFAAEFSAPNCECVIAGCRPVNSQASVPSGPRCARQSMARAAA